MALNGSIGAPFVAGDIWRGNPRVFCQPSMQSVFSRFVSEDFSQLSRRPGS